MTRPRLFPKAPKGERVRSINTTPTNRDLPECERCGRRVKNPSRRHKSPSGFSCSGARTVVLDELPEVVIPPEPKYVSPIDKRDLPGRMARGECHDCGRPISGERWYCGPCSTQRGTR